MISGNLASLLEEDPVDAESEADFANLCKKGFRLSVKQTMINNPRAESVWVNQKAQFMKDEDDDDNDDDTVRGSLQTPLHKAAMWGHTDTVALLLRHGAAPLLRARACKANFCRSGFEW